MGIFDALDGGAYKQASKNNQYAIASGTQLGGDALTTGYANAQKLLGTGDGSSGNALSAIGQGYGQARSDIGNQYGATQGYLGQLGSLYQPMAQGGSNAFNAYLNATGANGAAGAQSAAENFTASPGYQYGLDQALGAVQRSAASRGGLAGGNATSDILKTANGLASQGYQQHVSNLGNASQYYGQGLQGEAAGLQGQASASQNYGTQLGALGTGLGQNSASLYGLGSQQQTQFGQGVAGLQTGAANALVSNNNQLAKAKTDASANLLGGIAGVAQAGLGGLGSAGGFGSLTSLFSGGGGSSSGNPFSLSGFRDDQWI